MSSYRSPGETPPQNATPGFYPGYPSAGQEPESGGLGMGQALRAIARRWWLLVLGGSVALAAAWYMVPEDRVTYQGVAVVRFADARGELIGGLDEDQQEERFQNSDFMVSQIQVIRSRAVIGEAVDREGLRLLPSQGLPAQLIRDVSISGDRVSGVMQLAFRPGEYSVRSGSEEVRAAYGSPVTLRGVRFTITQAPSVTEATIQVLPRDAAIDMITPSVIPVQRGNTSILDISYTNPDPTRAQAVVNAVASAFQTQNTRGVRDAARRRREFIQQQMTSAEARLAQAQQALVSFRNRGGVYNSTERRAVEQRALLDLDTQRRQLQDQLQMYQAFLARVEQARDQRIDDELAALVAGTGTDASPLMTQLYTQLVQQQNELDQELAMGRAEGHENVQRLRRLVAQTRASVISNARAQLNAINLRIASVDSQRARVSGTIQSIPDPGAEEERLNQNIASAQQMIETLRAEYLQASMAESINVGQVEVLDYSTGAASVVQAGRTQKLAIALLFGLLLGGGGALLLEVSNNTVRRGGEVESQLAVPALAVIPRISKAQKRSPANRYLGRFGKESESPEPGEPGFHSTAAEAYRRLRTNLVFLRPADELRSLVVTSASTGEGKTTTAANLATAFAKQGQKVLLVDCDLRRPRLHEVFEVEKGAGFIELLLGRAAPTEAIRSTHIDRLDFLPRGAFDERAPETLSGAGTRSLIASFLESYDLVIFDTSPVLLTADSPVLAAMADGVLLVVRAGHTPREAVRQTMQQLNVVGAEVLGFVLNDPDAVSSRYGEIYQKEYYAVEA